MRKFQSSISVEECVSQFCPWTLYMLSTQRFIGFPRLTRRGIGFQRSTRCGLGFQKSTRCIKDFQSSPLAGRIFITTSSSGISIRGGRSSSGGSSNHRSAGESERQLGFLKIGFLFDGNEATSLRDT